MHRYDSHTRIIKSPHSPGMLAVIGGHTLQAVPHSGIAITLTQSLGCVQVMLFGMDDSPECHPLAFRHVDILPVQHLPPMPRGAARCHRTQTVSLSRWTIRVWRGWHHPLPVHIACSKSSGAVSCPKYAAVYVNEASVHRPTLRLFLSMTEVILLQQTLGQQQPVAGTTLIAAIEDSQCILSTAG